MALNKTDIYVYADWIGLSQPTLIGILSLNPSVNKDGLALNIDLHNNALDFELAKSVGEYFN